MERVLDTFGRLGDEKPADWQKWLAVRAMGLGGHAAARKSLLEGGWAAKELDRLPAIQVVVLAALDEHDRKRDDVVRLLSLPSWQGYPLMENWDKACGPRRRPPSTFSRRC